MAAAPHSKQDDAFFELLTIEVVKDFPKMPVSLLDEAITNGIKGYYSDGKNITVNSISIYGWIHERIADYREEQKKKQREANK